MLKRISVEPSARHPAAPLRYFFAMPFLLIVNFVVVSIKKKKKPSSVLLIAAPDLLYKHTNDEQLYPLSRTKQCY